MQALIIDDEFKSRISQVREFASRPENIYKPGLTGIRPPGDNPNYVVESGTIRIVFSLTSFENVPDRPPDFEGPEIYRHVSISANNYTSPPNPVLVREILDLLGFIGSIEQCDYFNIVDNIFIGLQNLGVHKITLTRGESVAATA